MSFLDSLFSGVWKQMGTEIYASVDIYISAICSSYSSSSSNASKEPFKFLKSFFEPGNF